MHKALHLRCSTSRTLIIFISRYDLFGVEDFPSAKDLNQKEKDRLKIKPAAAPPSVAPSASPVSASPEVPSAHPNLPHHKPFRWKKLERISKGVGGELYVAHNLTTREKFLLKEIVMTVSRKDQVRYYRAWQRERESGVRTQPEAKAHWLQAEREREIHTLVTHRLGVHTYIHLLKRRICTPAPFRAAHLRL